MNDTKDTSGTDLLAGLFEEEPVVAGPDLIDGLIGKWDGDHDDYNFERPPWFEWIYDEKLGWRRKT
jgi:hypothetical protein